MQSYTGMSYDNTMIREGMHVYSRTGEKLGKITACGTQEFLVEKGLFFKKDFKATYDMVVGLQGDDVIIDGDMNQWASEGYRNDTWRAEHADRLDQQRLQLISEEAFAQKRQREAGEVRISKEVRTEERTITVPVTREEVKVERVSVNEAAAPNAELGKDTIRVPVMEEEVEIVKRPVVREEVRVSKVPVQEQFSAKTTVRHEELDVDDSSHKARIDDDRDDPNKKVF